MPLACESAREERREAREVRRLGFEDRLARVEGARRPAELDGSMWRSLSRTHRARRACIEPSDYRMSFDPCFLSYELRVQVGTSLAQLGSLTKCIFVNENSYRAAVCSGRGAQCRKRHDSPK